MNPILEMPQYTSGNGYSLNTLHKWELKFVVDMQKEAVAIF
jgi:hypothetical protein